MSLDGPLLADPPVSSFLEAAHHVPHHSVEDFSSDVLPVANSVTASTPLYSTARNLPPEILSMILTLLYLSYPIHVYRRNSHPLRRLSMVSKTWKELIKTTPSLYTIIPVTIFTDRPYSLSRIRVHLQRSKSLPVSLIIESGYPSIAIDFLEPHRARWKGLLFLSSKINGELADPRPFLTNPVPALRSLEFNGQPCHELRTYITLDAPLLETLECVHQPVRFANGEFPQITTLAIVWDRLLRAPPIPFSSVLALADTLQELRISGTQIIGWRIPSCFPINRPSMTHLRKLSFDRWSPIPGTLLECIAFPQLYHLEIRQGGNYRPKVPFPTLENVRTLVWEESEGAANAEAFACLLRACPNLVMLSILNAKEEVLKQSEELKRSKERKRLRNKGKKLKLLRDPDQPGEPKKPKAFIPLGAPLVRGDPLPKSAVTVLCMVTGAEPAYSPGILDLYLHHTTLNQLISLVETRPSLRSVKLEACHSTNFVEKDGVLHVAEDRQSVWNALERALVRVEFPPNVMHTTSGLVPVHSTE